jgi:acyl carrier protein
MAALDVEQRRAALLEVVRKEVALVLGLRDVESVELDTALRDMGFDSLMAVELRNRLSALAGTTLPAMLAMDYPTVEKLSRKLAEDYFHDALEQAKNTRGLRTNDVDLALCRLREADLVDPLRDAGLLESVVELLGEISLREESRTSDTIDSQQAMSLVESMDADSIDAKLNSILDEST